MTEFEETKTTSTSSSLPPESLNQIPGRTQSLAAWHILKEDAEHWIVRNDDPTERHKSPDGSNFVEGVPHPPFIQQGNWNELRTARAGSRPTDTWVATFPKCGTTFMEQIVLLLRSDGDPSKLNPERLNFYDKERGNGKVWVEANINVLGVDIGPGPGGRNERLSLSEFEDIPVPRTLKTHAPRHMFLGVAPIEPPSLSRDPSPAPIAPDVKVVYVSRNAKDACTSAYYHAANPHCLGFPFDAWVKNWMSGLFEHGTWMDHVKGWRREALTNPEQVLWVRYEDILDDPEREIRRVAAHIGVPASDRLVSDVALHSGFERMKLQAGGLKFFRKGKVGDSRRHFSPSLDHEFDVLYTKHMRGCVDPYGHTDRSVGSKQSKPR